MEVFVLLLTMENTTADISQTFAFSPPPELEPHSSHRNLLAYVHFLVGTYIFCSNLTVVVAVIKFEYLQTRANMYILSLACTDTCVGAMEWVVGLHNHERFTNWFDNTALACVGMFSFAVFSVACSMFNTVLIAVDRYLFIMHPFFYQRFMTPRTVKLSILGVWITASCWGSIPLYINNYVENPGQCTIQNAIPTLFRVYLNVPLLASGVITTGTIYIIIARKAFQHRKAMYKSIGGESEQGISSVSDSAQENALKKLSIRRTIHTMKSNMKTLKLFTIVFGVLFVCWFPYYIIEFVSEFAYVPNSIYRVSIALGFMNSGVNVFVYALYNKKFRQAIREMICICFPPPDKIFSETTLFTRTKSIKIAEESHHHVPPKNSQNQEHRQRAFSLSLAVSPSVQHHDPNAAPGQGDNLSLISSESLDPGGRTQFKNYIAGSSVSETISVIGKVDMSHRTSFSEATLHRQAALKPAIKKTLLADPFGSNTKSSTKKKISIMESGFKPIIETTSPSEVNPVIDTTSPSGVKPAIDTTSPSAYGVGAPLDIAHSSNVDTSVAVSESDAI